MNELVDLEPKPTNVCFQTWPFPFLATKPASMDAQCVFDKPDCFCFLQCPALCPPGPPGPPGMPGFKVRKMPSADTRVYLPK